MIGYFPRQIECQVENIILFSELPFSQIKVKSLKRGVGGRGRTRPQLGAAILPSAALNVILKKQIFLKPSFFEIGN